MYVIMLGMAIQNYGYPKLLLDGCGLSQTLFMNTNLVIFRQFNPLACKAFILSSEASAEYGKYSKNTTKKLITLSREMLRLQHRLITLDYVITGVRKLVEFISVNYNHHVHH